MFLKFLRGASQCIRVHPGRDNEVGCYNKPEFMRVEELISKMGNFEGRKGWIWVEAINLY